MCLNQLLAVEEEQAKIVNLSFVHLFIEEQVYFFFKKKKKKERENEKDVLMLWLTLLNFPGDPFPPVVSINAALPGTATAWISPGFAVQERVGLVLRQRVFFLSVVKNNSLAPTTIIWIIAAPGVISQDCSPLEGGNSQKNNKVAPRWAPSPHGHGQQRRSTMGTQKGGSRPTPSLGQMEKKLEAAPRPGKSLPQVSVCGQTACSKPTPTMCCCKEGVDQLDALDPILSLISTMRFT